MINMLQQICDKNRYGKLWASVDKTAYRTFTTSEDAEAWGDRIYSEWAKEYERTCRWAKQISNTDRSLPFSALECYCGYSYTQINSFMRGDNSITEQFIGAADILALTIANAPPIPENIVVYRMVCDEFIEALIENNKEELPTIEKGFLSASLLKEITNQDEGYACHPNLLKIYVPKNTLGIYVNSVVSRSECEMLLAPNCYLRLIAYPHLDHVTQKRVFECELFEMNCRF